MWAATMWPIIDGHFLGMGVDISDLPLNRFLSIIENYYVEDQVQDIPDPEHKFRERERLRAEFIKYNRSSISKVPADRESDTQQNPIQYLEEPTSDGYLPGLQDGFLGES